MVEKWNALVRYVRGNSTATALVVVGAITIPLAVAMVVDEVDGTPCDQYTAHLDHIDKKYGQDTLNITDREMNKSDRLRQECIKYDTRNPW